ncbi:Prophage host-nuclease inhibitor protein [Citrobacter freundii]|uniref:host-nuclease inhibitor Gam family protein n=1 Tax=Citrobacter freundii TaxID=546 RepID=UPI003B268419
MKAPKKPRTKSAAAVAVPQCRDDVISDIRKIGDITRVILRRETELNDKIAALTNDVAPGIEALKKELGRLQAGVQTWCEANRAELTKDGKTKTANLTTGEVRWRKRPPSVTIRKVEDVIALLKKFSLGKFLRNKGEINKEAILASPNEVKGIAGISIKSDVEDFEIIPFEQTVTD